MRETRIEVEAGGNVTVSADEVGRDKVTGVSEAKGKGKPVSLIPSLISNVTKLVSGITKAIAVVKALVGL